MLEYIADHTNGWYFAIRSEMVEQQTGCTLFFIMKKLLVPIDFSFSSGKALNNAHSIAEHLGLNLNLLHCYSPHEYNRPHDFGEKDYSTGIRGMLKDFYKKHVGEIPDNTRFLACEGSLGEEVAVISQHYDLIILSGNEFGSHLKRWIGSRSSYIASRAKCPVLIMPSSISYEKFSGWEKIWHIKRTAKENSIDEEKLQILKIDPVNVEIKSFKQTTFKSALWRSVVAYVKTPDEEIRKALVDAREREQVDLVLLVSHSKDSLQKFVNDDALQIIFGFKIPVLIYQKRK